MYFLRRLLLLLPGRRAARARDLHEELQANLSLAIDDAPDARQARRDFGNLTRAHEEARAVWFPGWDAISQDVRFALRTLARAPVFTAVAVLSLALGTGSATALFSLVDTVVLKPLSYRDPDRLVLVREVLPPLMHMYPTMPVNFQHFRFWHDHATAFDSLAAVSSGTATLYAGSEPELIGTAQATSGLFDVLGVQAQIGRTFRPEEDQPAANPVVVITDSLWRRRFGASPEILSQTIRLGAKQYPVIGVLPASFHFPKKEDLGPLTRLAENTEIFLALQEASPGWGGDYDFVVLGRLRSGAASGQGVAELNAIEKRIADEHKLGYVPHVEMRSLQDVMTSPVRTSLGVLLAAVMLLVLIVCVNLTNLLLARGGARARECALRTALGASRGRLLMSALAETLLLACAGGALGVLAAKTAIGAFIRIAPVNLPRMDEVRIDWRVLAFAFGLSLLCGLFFGLLPALRLSQADPQTVLRGDSHTITGSRGRLRLREWLVGGEVALSTVLLVLAGLLVSSLWHVLRVDRGFSADRAIDIRLNLPSRYSDAKDRAAFFDLAAERLRTVPGVHAVAAASRVPLTGESNVNQVRVNRADALDPAARQIIILNVRFVGPEYFSALGIPLRRGRALEPADRDRNVAVVSERLAAKLWPNQDAIGQKLTPGSRVKDVEVVGIVGDVHATRLERDPTLMIYVPFWKYPYQVSGMVVRTGADPRAVMSDIRRIVQAIDSGIPAPKMRTMAEIVDESVAQRRFQMRVAVAFAGAALLLAALGIYGVVAYGITLRRREMGIRMALGARTAEIRRMVLRQGLRPVLLGLTVGMSTAVAAGSLVRTLLFGIAATDAVTLATVAAVLAAVATLACLMPARSAAALDPAQVLRED